MEKLLVYDLKCVKDYKLWRKGETYHAEQLADRSWNIMTRHGFIVNCGEGFIADTCVGENESETTKKALEPYYFLIKGE